MHKHADLIMKFAKMIAAGHPIDKLVQCINQLRGCWMECPVPTFDLNAEYRVAIAFVEGKPVFVGDKLWCMKYQEKVTVVDATGDVVEIQPFVTFKINIQMPYEGSRMTSVTDLSWTSPKPSIADLKINIDASAINEATVAMNNLTIATDEARMAMDRLRK